MYNVVFGQNENFDAFDADFFQNQPWETLEEIIDFCKKNQVSATLYNEPGFEIAEIDENGNYRFY